ncbi:MAG: hypothetical protein RL172_3024 [Bacteroidota bacterium]
MKDNGTPLKLTAWLMMLFLGILPVKAQTDSFVKTDSALVQLQHQFKQAMQLLDNEDTTKASPVWPNIDARLFYANLRKNLLHPEKINQGKATNFCGYAAITHILIKYRPLVFTKAILALYHTGQASFPDKTLQPSERIRQAVGTLKRKGELDVLHADQLWFLTLAEEFKGYVNIFDHKYKPGDENAIWAATNFSKFNRMLRVLGGFKTKSAGSDLLRPFKSNFYDYITSQLQAGVVLMYINSKYLHPSKYTLFKLRAPTHFIVLYEMYKIDDMIEIKYWDYGLKTEQLITKKRLRKLIFGVTTITEKNYEKN